MSTETSTLKLDLDAKEFLEKALHAKESIEKVGDSENLSGLISGLSKVGLALGVVGAAVFAVKEGMELVFEAEKIEKVNYQFELLAKNAGIVGNELKEGLVKAAGGLADDTEIIAAANKGFSEMGNNAKHMTETMQIARKVTSAFGGDLVENFEKLNMVVATGQTKLLKQMNIVIDADKAQRDYAKTLGKYKDDLTEADKKQAVFQAMLEQTNKTFKDIKPSTDTATTTMKQFKIAMGEVGESIALIASKYIKPILLPALNNLKETFQALNIFLKRDMGEGTEALSNRMEYLKGRLGVVRQHMMELSHLNEKWGHQVGMNDYAERLEAVRKQYQELLKEASSVQAKLNGSKKAEEVSVEGGGDGKENDSKSKTAIKFNQDLLRLKEERIKSEMELEDNYDKFQELRAEQLEIMHAQTDQKLAQIDEEYRLQGQSGSEANLEAKKEVLDQYANEVHKINQQIKNDNQTVADNAVKNSQSMTSAFAAGWKKASADSGSNVQHFAALGKSANTALTNSIVAGAKAMADGSENAAEAMKKAFFGYLGEKAMYAGAEMILENAWPPNPIGLGAGAALLALGAEMSSLSGGSAGAPSVGSAGGGGSPSFQAETAMPVAANDQGPEKKVKIEIHGNYYDTNDTRKTLMDMIRQETDNTGYSYVQINQGS